MQKQKIAAFSAVIFDLDGVIVSTDDFHYRAWKWLADKEDIPFDREANEQLRGISRMESLEIVLRKARHVYTQEEKERLANEKNSYYQHLITGLTPANVLPGALKFIDDLKVLGIKTAIASSSRNAPFILSQTGLDGTFDAVVSGNDITKSKPDPEVFLLASRRLNVGPACCLVIEDAYSGIDAAVAGGMRSLGVGYASAYGKADFNAESLAEISVSELLAVKG
jgi:beta-phosphoglucomutase